jgi:membrane-bound inhibitor of C-type lysozyme
VAQRGIAKLVRNLSLLRQRRRVNPILSDRLKGAGFWNSRRLLFFTLLSFTTSIQSRAYQMMYAKIVWQGAIVIFIFTISPVFAQTYLTFRCQDRVEFVAAFFPETRTAYLQLDGKAISLTRRISISGKRYSKGRITLWLNGHTAKLSRYGQKSYCTAD